MLAFVLLTLLFLLFLGGLCLLLYRRIKRDSYEYDSLHLWETKKADKKKFELR
ncbi:hypothetical protein MJA45_19395 [Paenibacillus aurantius]|uniref:DUF3951 domain-containing protein n=1 Tax=Paenibacillus aurantius TaxID=2918900 RepID=A0AA96L9T1_9BACL|nr:hypothetical protein [Paenibacillus aurantius]WNQ09774.1 hypothetical protein MJA45_19395 [Paenibacillus aurantius]